MVELDVVFANLWLEAYDEVAAGRRNARDLSWMSAETSLALRGTTLLRERLLDVLGHTVGMASRRLLALTC